MNSNEINTTGVLYIVPTPIGNLSDITYRAINILKSVHLIAAENIFHTKILLKHFNINTSTISINKNNEKYRSKNLISKLKNNKSIALVSNAGTPLINDPGYYLVNSCYEFKIKIIPLPGPCAAITALSASGLPTNQFYYEGFLSSKKTKRRKTLDAIKIKTHTTILYETTHRIIDSMKDIIEILGPNRIIVLAKELTKKWESIQKNTAYNIFLWLCKNKLQKKGEITIIIEGYKNKNKTLIPKIAIKTLQILKLYLSSKEALKVTSQLHNLSKNILYNQTIKNKIYTK